MIMSFCSMERSRRDTCARFACGSPLKPFPLFCIPIFMWVLNHRLLTNVSAIWVCASCSLLLVLCFSFFLTCNCVYSFILFCLLSLQFSFSLLPSSWPFSNSQEPSCLSPVPLLSFVKPLYTVCYTLTLSLILLFSLMFHLPQ